MTHERYSKELKVSLQDFNASGWKEAISQVAGKGYPEMWQALSEAARSAIEQGRTEHGKVLWLIADACSMMLLPSSPNEPFKPFAVFNDRRSVIPDDLSDTDIAFFTEIVDAVDDNWLKARLSDLLWLKRKPRDIEFARKAIDAYRSLPLDRDTWIRGGSDCWQRAISLVRMLKDGAGDRLQKMESSIVTAFDAAKRDEGFLGLWLADLLKSNGLGRAHGADVARKLEALAREFDGEGDLHCAREYFYAAAEWYRAISDGAKAVEMTVAVAEGWVKEAVAQTASENPSHMVAASFYENAIQTFRTVPKRERARHRVDERIAGLRARLNDSGERAPGEMWVIQTPDIDVSQLVESARKAVSGKSVEDALIAFSNLCSGVNKEKLRETVLRRMGQYPLQHLFFTTVMSSDGRVIAKRPAMSFGEDLTEDDEVVVRSAMISEYRSLVNIRVRACTWPALEVLLLEHRLREADFIILARNSPIVPKDRADLFGRALFFGYERDFVTALHVLVPQIEHMVRVHLKQAGAETTNYKDGIRNENGMSTLLALPKATQVFGKDLVFELTSLFCDPFGPNLRNELAHGLLDEDGCRSVYAIYAWWLALRLTVNTWWNSAASSCGQTDGNDEQGADAKAVEDQGEP